MIVGSLSASRRLRFCLALRTRSRPGRVRSVDPGSHRLPEVRTWRSRASAVRRRHGCRANLGRRASSKESPGVARKSRALCSAGRGAGVARPVTTSRPLLRLRTLANDRARTVNGDLRAHGVGDGCSPEHERHAHRLRTARPLAAKARNPQEWPTPIRLSLNRVNPGPRRLQGKCEWEQSRWRLCGARLLPQAASPIHSVAFA